MWSSSCSSCCSARGKTGKSGPGSTRSSSRSWRSSPACGGRRALCMSPSSFSCSCAPGKMCFLKRRRSSPWCWSSCASSASTGSRAGSSGTTVTRSCPSCGRRRSLYAPRTRRRTLRTSPPSTRWSRWRPSKKNQTSMANSSSGRTTSFAKASPPTNTAP